MHYIGDAYYLYIFTMKSILTSIAFLIIAFSVTAQPVPSLDCGPSTWDGTGVDIPQSASAFMCHTHSAPVGTYLHWDPFENTPNATGYGGPIEDLAEWNWDNIYGMKGRFGINFPAYIPETDTMSAQIFETQLNPTVDYNANLQTFTNPTFNFYGGRYKFNVLHIESATNIKVHAGAYIEIHSLLSIESGAVLEIEEGATVLLKSSRDNMCMTKIQGVVDGVLSKEIYFDVSDNWQAQNDDELELRWTFNPGLYDVDLNQVALDVQAATTVQLNNSQQKPSVQIGYWGRRPTVEDPTSMYPFAAKHRYRTPGFGVPFEADSGMFYGEAVINHDGLVDSDVSGQTFALRTNSMGGNFYNWNEGVSILPIYPSSNGVGTTDSELFNHWQSNSQFVEFASDEITSTSDLSEYARTTTAMDRSFTVSLKEMNSAIDDFKITIQGRFDADKSISVANATVSQFITSVQIPYPGATATYLGNPDSYQGVSTFYESTSVLDPPLSLVTNVDLYSRTGNQTYSNYRGLDYSGLSMLNNRSGNILNTYGTLFSLYGTGPSSQLALFDVAPIIGRQDSRNFQIDAQSGRMYEATSGEAYPIPVANLLIWDDTAPEYPGIEVVDFYNIEDMPIFYAIGDTIRPDEMLAYNFNNPADAQSVDGIGFEAYATLQEYPYDWYNKGGVPHSGGIRVQGTNVYPTFDTVYANFNNNPVYRKTEQVYDNNKPVLKSFKDVRTRVGLGNVNDEKYDWTIEELNDMNEMTLIRLAGTTSEGDTLTMAIVPVATDEDYSASEIDLFETSVAVNPIMYLTAPVGNHVMSRRWGSYGRGINDYNDTLNIVIDFEALDYVTTGSTITKLWIDCPVRQVGSCGLSGNNLVVAVTPGSDLLTWDPDFEYEIPLNSTYSVPNESGGTSEYGRGHLIPIYFRNTMADLNGDGCVTTSDLLVFLGQFGQNVQPGNFNSTQTDLNCDGQTTTSDMLILLAQFGTCVEDGGTTTGELPGIVRDRAEFYSSGWDNAHVTYDIIDDYPGFTAEQREFLNLWPWPCRISIVDDLDMVLQQDLHMESPFQNGGRTYYSIRLPEDRPTSAQLDTTSARFDVELPQTTPSYRIYIEWLEPVRSFPGIPGVINHICLGCAEDPNAVFPTRPIFVAN